jgi:type IV secretion system protein VirB6
MSSTNTTVISTIFDHIDQYSMNLVATTYQHIANQFSPLFYIFATIYLGFCFIKMQRGHYNFNDLFMIVMRMVIILTIALNYHYFCLYIYDVVTNEPLVIFHAIIGHGGVTEMATISQALDHFFANGMGQANRLFMMGSWSNPTYYLFGTFIFMITLITVALATGLIVLAKCASSVLLALSPFFIFLALYDATKGLFDAYIKQLISYGLIPIFTSVVLMILLSVSDVTIQALETAETPSLVLLMPFGLMCVVQIYLLLQVRHQCASLAGGFSLPTLISGIKQLQQDISSGGEQFKNIQNLPKLAGRAVHSAMVGKMSSTSRLNRFNNYK